MNSSGSRRHVWRCCEKEFVSRGALDVALLRLQVAPLNVLLQPLDPVLSPTGTACGDPVVCVGFSLVGPAAAPDAPLVFGGVVARVVPGSQACGLPNRRPLMLLSSCAVHEGASGGAIVCARTGRLVALPTSNARPAEKCFRWEPGAAGPLPTLNFSIPAPAIAVVFAYARGEATLRELQAELNGNDQEMASVWALNGDQPVVAASRL